MKKLTKAQRRIMRNILRWENEPFPYYRMYRHDMDILRTLMRRGYLSRQSRTHGTTWTSGPFPTAKGYAAMGMKPR